MSCYNVMFPRMRCGLVSRHEKPALDPVSCAHAPSDVYQLLRQQEAVEVLLRFSHGLTEKKHDMSAAEIRTHAYEAGPGLRALSNSAGGPRHSSGG
jgi:hypothetical protein